MKNYKSIYILPIIVLLTLFNVKQLSAQGPNSPEAASFEPIDATDMVNLVTGGFSYVLPLLNVPSPEGGYPIALSYHAGIAMDQEASWVGLGWSLNPGAINRSVNGYPDDYNNALLEEYFYDKGDTETVFSVSFGYGHQGLSVGLGFSWGSHKSLGGTVSIGISPTGNDGGFGIGVSAGENGVGINAGYTTKGGLSFGIGANSNGTVSGSFDTNSVGFSISSNGSVGVRGAGKSGSGNIVSTGITFSSNGISINGGVRNKTGNTVDGGLGVGLSLQFENTVSMGDYSTRTSGWMIPIMIPTKVGVFSLMIGKQKFKYWLGKNEYNLVSGPINYNQNLSNNFQYRYKWLCGSTYRTEQRVVYGNRYPIPPAPIVSTTGVNYMACDYRGFTQTSQGSNNIEGYHSWYCSWSEGNYIYNTGQEAISPCDGGRLISETIIGNDEFFMDIYEVALSNSTLSENTDVNYDNPVFPNYDKYNVQAQGLSGGMSSRLFENGNLFGLSEKENDQGYMLRYGLDGSSSSIPNHAKFDSKPYFYFDNEISTYLGFTDVNEARFHLSQNNPTSILSYYDDFNNSVETNAKPRRRNGTYIDYYTVKDLRDNYTNIKSEGYLAPNPNTGFDINANFLPQDGIAAFKITSADGKTYHYSLPVYNHEIVTRTYGVIPERKEEDESYQEKRQLEPYATHWLLTAVTGPDYIDANNNGFADIGDYGFWTAFEYGKWSEAFAWKTPYGKDYFENNENQDIKTRIEGRKQVYYLDRIKTRTHTAVFVKSERNDGLSHEWVYKSVSHVDDAEQNETHFNERFTIPSQKPLRLDKIILVKNLSNNDLINKASGVSNSASEDVVFNDSSKPAHTSFYNRKDNVVDVGDTGIADLESRAIKVIDFNYDYSLAKGSPNTILSTIGRLTLNSVDFKGKTGEQVIPPYKFAYNNSNYQFNINDKGGFGYNKNDNKVWSLNEITTPQGGKIQVDYESNRFKSLINSKITFGEKNQEDYNIELESTANNSIIFTVESNIDLGISIGDQLFTKYISNYRCCYRHGQHGGFSTIKITRYNDYATVTESLGNNKYRLVGNGNFNSSSDQIMGCQCGATTLIPVFTSEYFLGSNIIESGGIRVASLTTSDDVNSYKTKYSYGQNGNGFISYLPFAPELNKELPYSSELPPPKVMYEYVAVESFGSNNQSNGKTQYKFKVLKEKDSSAIKFGDLYSIETYNDNNHYNATADKDVEIKSYRIHDNLASLGQLLEVSTFNSKGQLLSKIENTYYSTSNPTPDNIGVTKEAFQSYKEVDYKDNSVNKDKWLINSSSRIKYPSLLKSSKEYKGGYSFTTNFGELDTITGEATELLSYSSNGLKFKTQTIPAYYKYSNMGSMVDDANNKNMLAQVAANYTYLIDQNNTEKVVSAAITTWNNDWTYRDYKGSQTSPENESEKVWRKHKSYVWEGQLDTDGTYLDFNQATDDEFDWGVGATQTNAKWKQVSETTRYNHFSLPLESKDVNDNYVASKVGDTNSKIIATANAAYVDMYYSGAEYTVNTDPTYFDSEIKSFGRELDTTSHTGSYLVRISPGENAFEVNVPAINNPADGNERTDGREKFKVSVWVKTPQKDQARIKVNGATVLFREGETITAGGWTQLNGYITIPTTGATVAITSASGTIDLDDFRLHPVASSMTSYVYNQYDEVEYITGANGLSTKYVYNKAGELSEVYSEVIDQGTITGGFKLVKKYNKHYKN